MTETSRLKVLVEYSTENNLFEISEDAIITLSSLSSRKLSIINFLGVNKMELVNHFIGSNIKDFADDKLYYSIKESSEEKETSIMYIISPESNQKLTLISNLISSNIIYTANKDFKAKEVLSQLNNISQVDCKKEDLPEFLGSIVLLGFDFTLKAELISKNITSALNLSELKINYKPKSYKTYTYNGNTVLSLIVNYLDAINSNEKINISSCIQNYFLSKVKTKLDDLINNLRITYSKKVDDSSLPIDPYEIVKLIKNDFILSMESFFNNSEHISMNELSDYISILYIKSYDIVDENITKNKEHFEEYLKQEIKSLDMDFNKIDPLFNNKLDSNSSKDLLQKLKQTFLTSFQKIADIPNMSDMFKFSSVLFKKFIEETIFSRFNLLLINYSSNISNLIESSNDIDEYEKKLKSQKEQIGTLEKTILEKNLLIKSHEENIFTIQLSKEKLQKELNNTSIVLTNEINLERDKKSQKEANFQKTIKEKDEKLNQLEQLNIKLARELTETHNDYSSKINELKKEITKLTIDSERSRSSINSSLINSQQSTQMQQVFKSIKDAFDEFKEGIDKLDKEKDSHFKFKNLESLIKENELNYSKWKEEIKDLKNEITSNVEKAYESKITKLREELNDISFKLYKAEYSLNEEREKAELLKKQTEFAIQENDLIRKILMSKDGLISSQKENYGLLENKLTGEEKNIEDLEMRLHKVKVEYEMGKDENEIIFQVVDDILSKNSAKYKSHINKLSQTNVMLLDRLIKKYKIF